MVIHDNTEMLAIKHFGWLQNTQFKVMFAIISIFSKFQHKQESAVWSVCAQVEGKGREEDF